jgi:hypothetical protein
LPSLQKKRKRKDGKGSVKQNKRRRKKIQNVQLKKNFSKK